MSRIAVLMAVLIIGVAAHSLISAIQEGARLVAQSGLLGRSEAVSVVRVSRDVTPSARFERLGLDRGGAAVGRLISSEGQAMTAGLLRR